MAFSAQEMHFPVFYPNPELLKHITAGSNLKTPQKVLDVMGELVFPAPSSDRPYLYGCMVLSFDGKMGFMDNPEGHLISKANHYDPIGGKADFWIMNVCRTYADAVILGTGTLKARINKLWYAEIADPDLVQARDPLGRKGQGPLNIVASIDGRDVPFEHPIFTGILPRPLVITSRQGADYILKHSGWDAELVSEPRDLAACGSHIQIIAKGEERPDTKALMRLLRDSGLEYVSVEAPGYIWNLIRENLLDEYLLNYSGVMAGGSNIVGGWAGYTVENHPHAALLSVGYHKGFLFTRQKLVYGGKEQW